MNKLRALLCAPLMVALLLWTGAASSVNAQGGRYERLYAQLEQTGLSANKLAFLTEEAVRAGVTSFILVATSERYGRSGSNGQIELSTALSGGTGVINITHEIAHIASFKRGCRTHAKCWIEAYLAIAQRYEARFPGEKWSGVKPTQRVLQNVERYAINM